MEHPNKVNWLGEKNPRWNGGNSQYFNHSEMKRARKKKIEKCGSFCEICKKAGSQIHHIDGSKNNHSIENLLFLCPKCHMSMFHKQKNTLRSSCFRLKYGLSVRELAKKLGFSIGKTHSIYKFNKEDITHENL